MRTCCLLWLALMGCNAAPESPDTDGDPDPTEPTSACVPVPEQCDDVDNDCDGQIDEGFDTTWYADADGDGLGLTDAAVQSCEAPADHVAEPGDCDDEDPTLTGPVGEVRYRDVTGDAGVDWLHWDPTVEPCSHEQLAGGAAIADYDNDGDLDIFLPRLYSQDLLLDNDGDGTFREVSSEVLLDDEQGASNGAVWLDIDGDRDLDLYVTSLGRTGARLWVNHGPGNYFTEEATARGVAVDFGEDCALSFSASAADVDGDGDLDLHTAAWFDSDTTVSNPRSRLFLNDGFGGFTDGTTAMGVDLSDRAVFTTRFEDVDLDGWPDLLVVADGGRSFWLRNANGAFFAQAQDEDPFTDDDATGTAAGDIDGDGDIDWFVSAVSAAGTTCPPGRACTGNRLYRNDGGRFVDATAAAGVRDGGWGWGAALFDHDNDGDLDLGQAAGYPEGGFDDGTAHVWLNDGTGAFTEATCETALVDRGQGRAFLPFDSDNDGHLDVMVVHNGDLPTLWRAEGAEDRGWLRVVLDQPASKNTYAIGATVRVIAALGDDSQTRWITANSGFVAAGPPEAHFGLGDHAGTVEQVLVTWPDGNTTSYANVGPGLVTLTRP